MNYAMILAGGTGSRMASATPKQFLEVGGKPIIIHTLEVFNNNPLIDEIIVVCHPEWVLKASQMIDFYIPNNSIKIVKGGTTRNESIFFGLEYLINGYNIMDEDIVLTHDSVRPFINDEVIKSNIELCKIYKAVGTVTKTVDTIFTSKDGLTIDSVPNRDYLYNAETPQTFNIKELYSVLNNGLNYNDFTDLCGLYKFSGKEVYITVSSENNFKITTLKDLEFANNIM